MTSKATSLVNIALMLILILVWGSSFVVVKWVLQYNITPIAIATFRFLVAGGFFVLALALIKYRKQQYFEIIYSVLLSNEYSLAY